MQQRPSSNNALESQRRHGVYHSGSESQSGNILLEQMSTNPTTAVFRSLPKSATGPLEQEDPDRSIGTSVSTPIIVLDENQHETNPVLLATGKEILNQHPHHHHQRPPVTQHHDEMMRTNNRSGLDLCHNDNSFHVLAELLVDFFQQKHQPSDHTTYFVFVADDRNTLQRILPESSVQPFIEALRHRLAHPEEPTNTPALQNLVQKCHELRLDEEDKYNPILTLLQMNHAKRLKIPIHPRQQSTRQPTTNEVRPNVEERIELSVGESDVSIAPVEPKDMVREESSTVAAVDTPRTASEDAFRAVLAGSFSSKSDTGNKKIRNRQQTEQQRLGMEIQEAKHLMNTSVEVETKAFWKSHLTKLQAQLNSFRPEPIVVEAEEAPVFPLDRKPSESQSRRSDHHRPMVDVVAPADLPTGYRFEAEIEGQRFIATVPPPGVQQGETFTCVMQELDSVAIDIPVGRWKDGSGDLCSLGCCHPTAWHAVFCPLILLSQIQTRLELDFLGRPRFGNPSLSNRSLMLIVVLFWFLADVVLFTACNIKWSQGLELTSADWSAVVIVNLFMIGFVMFVAQSTRSSLREKYMIREACCFDLEDLCCAVTCLPCSVAQMARHTANYHEYEAVCCSKTGLPDGVKVDKQ